MKPIAASTAFPPLAGLLAVLLWFPAAHAQTKNSASVSVTIKISPFASIDFPDGFDFAITVPEPKKGKGHDKDKGKGHDDHGNGKGKGHDDDDGVVIEPVLIPFKVVGNAVASISAKPDAFMRVYRGPWLGEAVKPGGDRHKNQQGKGHDDHGDGKGNGHGNDDGGTLGYNVIVQFPIHSWDHADTPNWQGYATSVPDGLASLPGHNGAGTPPLTADAARHRHGLFGMIYVVAKEHWTIDGRDAAPGDYAGALEVTVIANEE